MTSVDVVHLAILIRELVYEMEATDIGFMGVPMGPCYMAFLTKGIDLDVFNQVVNYLVERNEIVVHHDCMFPAPKNASTSVPKNEGSN